MKKNENGERRALYFNLDNKDQYIASMFFSKCGRKQSKFISTIIVCFLEQYGLDIEALTKEELTKFFEILPIIKNMNNRYISEMSVPFQGNKQESNETMKESKTVKEKTQKKKRDKIRQNMTF
ncbi:MAG: hypothetical protein K2K56_15260 [Lachnospiraceae bacterium]|nr:hypothetical protein [Lachnospiraceae bacterium]